MEKRFPKRIPASNQTKKPTKAKAPPDIVTLDLRLLKSKFDEVRAVSKRVLSSEDRDHEYYDTKANILNELFDEVEKIVFEPIVTEEKERAELARLLKKYGAPE